MANDDWSGFSEIEQERNDKKRTERKKKYKQTNRGLEKQKQIENEEKDLSSKGQTTQSLSKMRKKETLLEE